MQERPVKWALLKSKSLRRVTGKVSINKWLQCLTTTYDPIDDIEEFSRVPNRFEEKRKWGLIMGPLYAAKTDPVEYVRMVRKAKRRDNRDLAIIVAVLLLVSYGIVRLFF